MHVRKVHRAAVTQALWTGNHPTGPSHTVRAADRCAVSLGTGDSSHPFPSLRNFTPASPRPGWAWQLEDLWE